MKNSKRRGAVKVPNVILRPAQASTSRSTQEEAEPRAASREEEIEADVDLTTGNKPFCGVVLCSTGDLDKSILFGQALEMGAIRSNDFTDLVTHLVADAPGSAKYKCAVERNLPILAPSWVQEAYNIWLNGDVVNFNELLEKHRLPIFMGVRLCITGLDDTETRIKIHSMLTEQGGAYLKALDTTVTHLLCSTLESFKIEWTHDYNQTQKVSKRIRMVWEEWFWDSLEFGGQWNEAGYDISKERPVRKSPSEASANLQTRTESMPKLISSQHTSFPQSIPTESLLGDDVAEYGQPMKPRHVGLRILESLVQVRGLNKEEDLSRPVVKKVQPHLGISVTEASVSSKESQVSISSQGIAESSSVLTLLSNQRVTSFASPARQPEAHQPFRRVTSLADNTLPLPQGSFMNALSSSTSGCFNLFAGQSFRAYGEANGEVLRNVVGKYGGRWTENEEENVDFILVRLVDGTKHWRHERYEERRAKYRTECWVEHCLFEERICKPDEHVSFTPLKIDTPVEGAGKLIVSMSGLDSEEACWSKRLIRVIGGSIPQKFSRRSTHLICPAFSGDKYEKAKEWHVQVVDSAWLRHIVIKGNIPEGLGEITAALAGERTIVKSPIFMQMDTRDKGKPKDTESEGAMVDVTNGHSQEPPFSKHAIVPSEHSAKPSLEQFGKEGERFSHFQPPGIASTQHPSLPLEVVTEPVISFGQPILLHKAPRTSKAPSDVPSAVSPSSRACYTPSRKSVTENIDNAKLTAPIPSSVSPSPLKISARPHPALSPTTCETLGIMTAITALLGKRGADVKEGADSAVSMDRGRAVKRPRLLRQNTDMELGAIVFPALNFINEASSQSYSVHEEDGDVFTEEGPSLGVRYEDPAQRAEKDRLISLFEQKPQNGKGQCGQDGDRDDCINEEKTESAALRAKKKLVRRTNRSSGLAN